MPFYWWKRVPKQPPPKPDPRTNVGGEALPFSVQSDPIVGYRLWRVKPSLQGGMGLWSIHTPYEWEAFNRAECMPIAPPWPLHSTPGIETHDDPAPSIHHSCGLYTSLPDHPISEWLHTVSGRLHASGTVALTGRVIRCALGFKGEYAEIQSPVVLDVDCASSRVCLAGVEFVDPQPEYVRGWCPDHAPDGSVEAEVFLSETVRSLEARYPDVEFLSFMEV